MQKEKLTNLELAIISAHTVRRFLMGYKPHERTSAIEQMLKKISKFLRHREKTNLKIFTFATEFERVLWQNVTDKYDKHTKIFALGFTISVYSYYGDHLKSL